MSRLSLRLRLTLAFAAVMAIAIGTIGLVIYLWFRSDLNATIDRGLSSRSNEVTALITRTNASDLSSLARVSNEEDDFAQVLRANATVLAATPQVPSRPVLVGDALRRALGHVKVVERGPIEQLDGPVRIRTVPVDSPYGHVVVAVGTTLGDRDHALSTLALLLALGGAAALSLASLAGYGVATAALAPGRGDASACLLDHWSALRTRADVCPHGLALKLLLRLPMRGHAR